MSSSGYNNKLQKQQQQPSWRAKESRHYCAVCNAWMGNDRQSILLHENGKKHKENAEQSLKAKRDAKLTEDKQQKELQSSLKAMEAAAMQSMASGPDSLYYDTASLATQPSYTGAPLAGSIRGGPMYYAAQQPMPPYHQAAAVPPPPIPQQQQPKQQDNSSASAKKEKKEWENLKKQRQEEKRKKEQDGDEDEDDTANAAIATTSSSNKHYIAPEEGHYQSADGTTTYLEGPIFYEILEEDMPLQIWIGSHLTSEEERKLAHHSSLWVNGLVVALRRKRNLTVVGEDPMAVDVAYLKSAADTDETVEQGIALNRIRIVLGGDDSIPETVEEARILAMGGEEIHTQQQKQPNNQHQQDIVDEATGLTGWSTVTIKRTTVHQEAREERARERAKQRAARRTAEEKAKEAEARKMDESKVANAEDSALGAFDVWAQTQGKGYKGVDIHSEAHVTVEDTAKRLAGKGEKVAFKSKSKFKNKMAGKKRNRRTTSADDDG